MGIERVISAVGEILSLKSTPSGILLAGYDTIEAVDLPVITVAAGTQIVAGATIPAGQVWVLENADLRNVTRGGVRVILFINPTGNVLIDTTELATINTLVWYGLVHLKAGESVRGAFYATVIGDLIQLRYRYRKILVPS
jgi:hypothetical protein